MSNTSSEIPSDPDFAYVEAGKATLLQETYLGPDHLKVLRALQAHERTNNTRDMMLSFESIAQELGIDWETASQVGLQHVDEVQAQLFLDGYVQGVAGGGSVLTQDGRDVVWAFDEEGTFAQRGAAMQRALEYIRAEQPTSPISLDQRVADSLQATHDRAMLADQIRNTASGPERDTLVVRLNGRDEASTPAAVSAYPAGDLSKMSDVEVMKESLFSRSGLWSLYQRVSESDDSYPSAIDEQVASAESRESAIVTEATKRGLTVFDPEGNGIQLTQEAYVILKNEQISKYYLDRGAPFASQTPDDQLLEAVERVRTELTEFHDEDWARGRVGYLASDLNRMVKVSQQRGLLDDAEELTPRGTQVRSESQSRQAAAAQKGIQGMRMYVAAAATLPPAILGVAGVGVQPQPSPGRGR